MKKFNPEIIKIYNEAELFAEQNDLIAEGWALWSRGATPGDGIPD